MAVLEASTFNRVSVTLADGTSFGGVRGSTTGTSKGSITTSFSQAVMIIKDAGRGAGTFRVRRGFLKFNTSGITGTVSAATLSLTVASSGPDLPKLAIVRGTADGSDLVDFDAITGFNNSATMAGNVTDLVGDSTTNVTNFSGVALNATVTMTLNSTARGLMSSENALIMVLVSHEFDYKNIEPSSNGFFEVGLYGPSVGTTSFRPHIDYIEVAAGYSHAVNGIASSNIGEINTIATANVDLFNGV